MLVPDDHPALPDPLTLDPDTIDSVVLQRIIREMQQEHADAARSAGSAYDRSHNRHNRGGAGPYNRGHNRHNRGSYPRGLPGPGCLGTLRPQRLENDSHARKVAIMGERQHDPHEDEEHPGRPPGDPEHPAHPHGVPPGHDPDRPEKPDKPDDEEVPEPTHPIVIPPDQPEEPDDPHVEHHEDDEEPAL